MNSTASNIIQKNNLYPSAVYTQPKTPKQMLDEAWAEATDVKAMMTDAMIGGAFAAGAYGLKNLVNNLRSVKQFSCGTAENIAAQNPIDDVTPKVPELTDDVFNQVDDVLGQVDDVANQVSGNNGDVNSWFNLDGSINYPPNNGAVPGTETDIILKPGDVLGRYGEVGPKSNFVTQAGADVNTLALPPNTNPSIYQEYEVVKEIPGTVQATISDWAGSTGGGLQYELPRTIRDLLADGYIIEK